MGIIEINDDAAVVNGGGDHIAIRREADQLPLLSLNHVSFVCKSVAKSVEFYEQVLGFVLIKRPSSFDFEGAWLFNHGIGIHLLQAAENINAAAPEKKCKINPKDNHISFQCTDMELIINQLKEMKIEYVTALVKEGGIVVDQLFFHDPDGYMIEICNCQNLPVLPISSCPTLKKRLPINPNNNNNNNNAVNLKKTITSTAAAACSGEVELAACSLMMENLAMDMLNLSI